MDELQRAQASLGRAVARARAGEDPVLAAQVRERGEQFANLFTGLVRMGHVHAATNHAFDQPTADLKRVLDGLLELLGPVHLVTVEDQVYLNEVRLKVHAEGAQKGLGPELARHHLGGVSFHAPLTVEQVRAVVSVLAGKPAAEHPRAVLVDQLRAAGVNSVEVVGLQRFRMSSDATPAAGVSATEQGLVARVAREVEQSWDLLVAGRQPNMLALRRLVTEVLQADPGHVELWLAPRGTATPHGWHAWRVAQVTLLIARGLGLPPSVQQDFGVAALLHDVGYAVPGASFEGHPMTGARLLLKQLGFHEAKVRRLDAVLHHHGAFTSHLPLVARAVRLAEDFDTATRAGGLSPPEALAWLAAGAGREFDPVLTQVLINALGLYPPGTYLALEDGRIVLCASAVRRPELFAKPLTVLIRRADGSAAQVREWVDLAAEGVVRGPLKPRVASSPSGLHPWRG
ncbi:MAG: HD-GYP domain-containing protein [Myxococcota bacterium]